MADCNCKTELKCHSQQYIKIIIITLIIIHNHNIVYSLYREND